MAGLALRHGINANQLRRWMVVEPRLAAGQGVALLPVTIEAALALPAAFSLAAAPAAPTAAPSGPIEIEVFGARLRLHGEVDAQRLRVVLDALARRP